MTHTHTSRGRLRIQRAIFLLLFLGVTGLLGWLSTRYHFQSDWTATARHTLSEASVALLEQIEGPVAITAFAREEEMVRKPIAEIVARYQRAKPDIALSFVNPDTAPDRVRAEGITVNGELVVAYQGRRENLRDVSEQGITNTLQRLARAEERWLVFLEGHGERNPLGGANHDLGDWGEQLKQKGLKIQPFNLASNPQLPANTAVLVIADPQLALLPGEIAIIRDYVSKGGNLLWAGEPSSFKWLKALADDLGVSAQEGIIVDPNTRLLGITDARFALVAEYPMHPVTQELDAVTLFPQAGGLEIKEREGWRGQTLLASMERSWLETSAIVNSARFDAGQDRQGPVTLALALTRERPGNAGEQRVVVAADGDFLSNTYLGNGGNLDLGLAMVNWLSHDDRFITIPARMGEDRSLELSLAEQGAIGFGFFLVIPGLLLTAGLVIWLRRRKR